MKLSYLIKSAVLLSVFAVCFMAKPNICFAAESENQASEVITLEKDKVYEYDLNGDGKADKIQYKITADDEEFTTALDLYINDKLCMARNDHGFTYTIQLCDLDKNDNHLDLYGYVSMESDCIDDSFFAQYNGEGIDHIVSFDPEKIIKHFKSIRYSLRSADGNGKFTVDIDTPVSSDAIGCYYCSVPFQLKDNAISAVSTKAYNLTKYSAKYKYKAEKRITAYAAAGSKKAAYTVKKGEKVTFDKLYLSKSGKAYFRMKNSKGKTGWIKSDQTHLFAELPMWG